MRMPMLAVAPTRLLLLVTVAGFGTVACAGDATAPTASLNAAAAQPSPLSPTDASHSLLGVVDGTYTFTIDPSKKQSLDIGQNHLDIPENAICRFSDSGYGPKFWAAQCKPEKRLVTITATVRDAQTDHPRVDFEPALRFAPDKKVLLYIQVNEENTLTDSPTILYCSTYDRAHCVDESVRDPKERTRVQGNVVSRLIRHFSGYVVTSRSGYVVTS